MVESSSTELSRDLGPFAVFSLNAGTMIGAGIFVLPGPAVNLAGPSALLAFLLAGCIALTSAISVSELATGMPKSGGSYYFLSRTFGPAVGSIIGWGSYFGLTFKGAFALEGFGDYFVAVISAIPLPVEYGSLFRRVFAYAELGPGTVVILGTLVCLSLMLVNSIGARASGFLQTYTVMGLLVILGLFVAIGVFYVDPNNFHPFFEGETGGGASGMLAATGLIFVSFLGVVKASAVAGEVRNPSRNLPLGIISSVAAISLLYTAVMAVIVGIQPDESSATLIFDVSTGMLGTLGGLLMGVAGLFATLSTGNAALMASSRYPFAMARDNFMGEWLTETNETYDTPIRTILLTGSLMILLIVLTDVQTMAKMGGVFLIVILTLINLAVIVLRNANPRWYDPGFKSPLYPWVQLLGIFGTFALVLKMGFLAQVSALVFLGWGLFWVWWYSDQDLKPGFNFLDILQQVDHSVALNEAREEYDKPRRDQIVIGLTHLEDAREMIRLAASSAENDQELIHLVRPREVPTRAGLSFFDSGFSRFDTSEIEGTVPPEITDDLEKFTHDLGMNFQFSELLTRDTGEGLVSFCREHPVDLLLLDWHENFTRSQFHESHVYYAVRRAPCDVAVLRDRGITEVNRVLMATRIGPYDELEYRLASGIARAFNGSVTLHHVTPPDQGETQLEEKRDYLQELASVSKVKTSVKIQEADKPTTSIIEMSHKHDLVVLGVSGEAFLNRVVFGNVPELVAQHVETSVLLVRGKRSARQGLFRSLLERFVYGIPS